MGTAKPTGRTPKKRTTKKKKIHVKAAASPSAGGDALRVGSKKRPHMGEENSSDHIPLLFVDVNLGAGNKPRIALYPGDDPDDVAAAFCQMHGKF